MELTTLLSNLPTSITVALAFLTILALSKVLGKIVIDTLQTFKERLKNTKLAESPYRTFLFYMRYCYLNLLVSSYQAIYRCGVQHF